MTVSEQIREVALYSSNPFRDMPFTVFLACFDYREFPQLMHRLNNTDCRTFMLLVAEVLK